MKIGLLLSDFPWITEDLEICETYPLKHSKLYNILEKIASQSDKDNVPHFFLRKNGIQIYVNLKSDTGGSSSLPLGLLVSGSHLGKDASGLYLITFRPTSNDYKEMKSEYDLVDLLKEYIN